MELIRKKAFARAGLVGNPSDGYHGKTISVIVDEFAANVTLYEWDQLEIVWSQEDRSRHLTSNLCETTWRRWIGTRLLPVRGCLLR